MKRSNAVSINWTPNFAYALGLMVSDGCLSKDGRHLELTSKDQEVIESFRQCLDLKNKISRKTSGKSKEKRYFRVQFGSLNYYEFLLSVGLTPAKSKTIGPLTNFDYHYFADYLRGYIDGDGSIDTRAHPQSQYPQLRTRITSASKPHLAWLHSSIKQECNISGGCINLGQRAHVLSFGKNDSIVIFRYIYYPGMKHFLKRKFQLAKPFMRMWPNW